MLRDIKKNRARAASESRLGDTAAAQDYGRPETASGGDDADDKEDKKEVTSQSTEQRGCPNHPLSLSQRPERRHLCMRRCIDACIIAYAQTQGEVGRTKRRRRQQAG